MFLKEYGSYMYELATDLFPICRSLTGRGVRETLTYLSNEIEQFEIHGVDTGTRVFDWEIPREWEIKEAYLIDPSGKKIIDFKDNNLCIVGYSCQVNKEIELNDLKSHLYTLPSQPNAIPYVTSYYEKNWGFCLEYNKFKSLKKGYYHAFIDSKFKDGKLNYGEIKIKGKLQKEIFLSTYICHPSMANNELSGPVLAIALAKWIATQKNRKYTYRIIFIPETIGSITYLSKNIEYLKKNVIAGFNLTCVGDNKTYSFLPSRNSKTLSDKASIHVLKNKNINFTTYSWQDRGSDERQYCAPGVDLPIASIMRSKFGTYPEYHTSLDNLNFISIEGLQGSFEIYVDVLRAIEKNIRPLSVIKCEPQLSKRGLYETISSKENYSNSLFLDLLTYSDGQKDLLEIAEILGVSIFTLWDAFLVLKNQNLITYEEVF